MNKKSQRYMDPAIEVTRIEAGVYHITNGDTLYLVERVSDDEGFGWRLFVEDLKDPEYEGRWFWNRDFETLRDAKQAVLDSTKQVTRRAECAHCDTTEPSSKSNLAFFEARPDRDTDLYYCGCWGWS